MTGFRFLFAPSGLGVTGEGIERSLAEGVVGRWCCSLLDRLLQVDG
ncbi:MAG: hypothetical protein ACC742_14765 [Thermoanaerobaculales bacterium]